MKKSILILYLLMGITSLSYSQYGGGGYGGGGFGGGGYGGGRGRGMSSMNQPQTARTAPTAKDIAKQETAWMKKNLKLTDAQLPIIEEINLDYAEQRDNLVTVEIKGEPTAEKYQAMKPKMEALQQRKDDELKRLFTPEQWETYTTKMKELKEKREKEIKDREHRRF